MAVTQTPPESLIIRRVNLAIERAGEHGGLADDQRENVDRDHIRPTSFATISDTIQNGDVMTMAIDTKNAMVKNIASPAITTAAAFSKQSTIDARLQPGNFRLVIAAFVGDCPPRSAP